MPAVLLSTAGLLEETLLPIAAEPHASPSVPAVSEVALLTMIRQGSSAGSGSGFRSEKILFLGATSITAKLSNS